MSGAAIADASTPASDATACRDRAVRVLFLIDTLQEGGAETSLLELTRCLDPRAVHPMICPLYDEPQLQSRFEQAGVTVIPLRLPGKYSFLAGIKAVRRVIRDGQVGLVHTTLFRAHQVGRVAAWLENRPLVSSFTSVAYDASRLRWDPPPRLWRHRVLQVVDGLTARLVTRFHSVSETARTLNCRDLRISPGRVCVIPRGRDIERLRTVDPSELHQRRETLGLRCAFPVLLHVGRLIPAKGQRDLIQAMPAICREFPQCRLLVAGAGPLHGELETLIESLGLRDAVRLLGRCSDIPVLLRLADLFVFPSYYEGLPGALMEAAIAGCPIVASDIPMNREVVEEGRSAVLFPPGDVAALVRAVCELASDSPRRLALRAAAMQDSQWRFDIHTIARETERFYREILTQGPGRAAQGDRTRGA